MALPNLPVRGQNPWYVERTNWDNAVEAELEGRLSSSGVTSAITNNAGVSVYDYGVILNGSTPTGASLQAAMNAAVANGLPLRLPAGRYLIDQVNIPSNLIVQGSGPGTVLVQRLADKTILQAAGSFTDGPVLTETLAKGATTINVANSYVAGDLIIVRNDAAYTSTDAGYKSGEMLEVLSATSSVITLKWPVRGSFQSGGSYTVADNSRIVKLTPKRNISLRDMTFECHPDQLVQAVTFSAVENLSVSGVSVTKGGNTFMGIDCCKDVDIRNWEIVETVDNHATGRPGYGFAIKQACYNVKVHDGTDHMSRHPVTTMGGPYGIPRLLEFYGITSSSLNSTAGIDTHAAGEGILIYGNIVTGNNSLGITVRARNVSVYGNLIIGCSSAGVIITESARDVTVHGNDIADCGYGVRVGSSTFVHSNITVSYNVIKRTKLWSGDSGSGRAILVSSAAHDNINISYNHIENTYGAGVVFPALVQSGSVIYNTIINASTGAGNPPYIDMTGGVSGTGSVDVIGNALRNVLGTPGRAIQTTRTTGRMVLNVATGSYLSAGTEFNAPVGWTKLDNKLYA